MLFVRSQSVNTSGLRMNIQSILALTDFSADAENALERAGLIAATHRAELRLMYVNETSDSMLADRETWLSQRAYQLSQRYGVHAVALARVVKTLNEVVDETQHADLMVLSPMSNRCFKDGLGGKDIDRVVRRSRCPVLIARNRAADPYAKAVVAFGSAAGLSELIRYARNFESQSVHLTVQVFVARRISRDQAIDEAGGKRTSNANVQPGQSQRRSFSLWRVPGAWGNGFASAARHDSVAEQIIGQRAEIGVDLVVVRRIKPPLWGSFLCRDASQRLVNGLDCDLVVVPEAEFVRPSQIASSTVHAAVRKDRRASEGFQKKP